MQDPYLKIVDYLTKNGIPFETIEHEPVFTSEQAAAVRGLSLKQGAKSLLLKTGETFTLAILAGDRKLNSKKLKTDLNTKDLRFATPDEVKKIMGCEIGACYPFGNLISVKMLVDNSISQNELISFNPGVHTVSIKLKWLDYYNLIKPQISNFST